jgi:hypothetical protein
MSEPGRIGDIENQKARRRAARELIGEYHEQQLRLLLDRVRDGFAQMDTGDIDPFELDNLIHHYKRAARKLWSFCVLDGSSSEAAAATIETWQRTAEPQPDWWEIASSHRGENTSAG